MDMTKLCTFPGCARPLVAKGYCDNHYRHLKKYGDPAVTKPRGAQLGSTNGFKKGNPSRPGPRPLGTYTGMHNKVYRLRGKATSRLCSACDKPAQEWAYTHDDPEELVELKNGHRYVFSLQMSYYIPLCVPCHADLDRRHRNAP